MQMIKPRNVRESDYPLTLGCDGSSFVLYAASGARVAFGDKRAIKQTIAQADVDIARVINVVPSRWIAAE